MIGYVEERKRERERTVNALFGEIITKYRIAPDTRAHPEIGQLSILHVIVYFPLTAN